MRRIASDVEKRITAKMVLDSSGFNYAIKGVNQQLQMTQSEFKAGSEKLSGFGKETEKLKFSSENLSRQIELQERKLGIWNSAIESTTNKMHANIKARDELKSKLDDLRESQDYIIAQYGYESEELKNLRNEISATEGQYKRSETLIESNARQIGQLSTYANNAEYSLAKMENELKNVNNELDKSSNKWLQASKSLKESSETLTKVGNIASTAGDKLLKISAPLIAGGIASTKFSMNFEDAMAKVSTISDDTQVPLDKLGTQILQLSDDVNIAATDIADNVYDAISAGQSTGDAVNFVTNSTKLAKAGFAEAGQSLDVLTTILNAYKMESKEVTNVSDLLIQVQNKGKVTVGELSSVMGKVIPTAVAANTSLQQLGAGYAIMTSNGIKAAESTTYMNSMIDELSKTGSNADKTLRNVTGKAFADLMKEGKSLGDVLNILSKSAEKSNLKLTDMFGSSEAGKAALVLSTNAGKDFNAMLSDMSNVAGATDEAFKKVTNTSSQRLGKSLNELKNNAIELGKALLPLVDSAAEVVGKLASRVGELDESQLKTIANVTLLTVGLGGFLKVGGGVITTVGNIAGGLSKLSAFMGTATVAVQGAGTAAGVAAGASGMAGLGTAISGVLAAAAPWAVGIGAVTLAGVGLYKSLQQEVIPTVDLFANKVEYSAKTISDNYGEMTTQIESNTIIISDSTKKAVGAYIKMDDEITKTMTNLYVNSSTITTDTSNSLTTKFNDMGIQIKIGIDKHYTDMYGTMETFFKNSAALSDREEAEALRKLKENTDFQKGVVDGGTKEIQTILERASKEKRELTSEERSIIANIQDNMKKDAVKALSETEIESKVILERLKGYSSRITSEQAAEIVKNANETRDKAVKAANDQYDKTLASIIKMRDESGTLTTEQADKLITEATRQKDEAISKANEMKEGVVDKLKKMNPDIEKEVNFQTGTIMKSWDKVKNWWDNLWFQKKTMEVETKYTYSNPSYTTGNNPSNNSPSYPAIGHNARGTNSWRGGLTTLHEEGYEIYELQRGTRIYNHEASEDMVLKTAEAVASRLIGNSTGNGEVNVTQHIYAPTSSPSEVARQTKNNLRELALSW